MEWKIVHTEDGSKTIYSKLYDATYHSVHGAVAESKHVFIENGLKYIHGRSRDTIRVLEIGFGTGLNAMLSCEYAQTNKIVVNYTGIEKHEVPKELLSELNYHLLFDEQFQKNMVKIHEVKNHELAMISPHFQLLKNVVDVKEAHWNSNYDVIYFDAFSPNHVPYMWTKDVFKKLYAVLNKNGALVTFSAQGQFRRDLKEAGFKVEKLPGAPGKREMTRGVKE